MSIILYTALTALITYLLYTHIIHPLFLHPLHSIPPAHPTAALSSHWIYFHRRGGSQALSAITAAHARHGPIVRLSPTEISVATYAAAKIVYVDRGGFAKPKWWAEEFITFGVKNMVSMEGGVADKRHARRKRDHGSVYAKTALLGEGKLERIAKQVLGTLVERLDDLVEREEGTMDVFNFNGAVNADFVSAYLFGRAGSTSFVEKVVERDEYFRHHGLFLRGEDTETEGLTWLEKMAKRYCEAVEKEEKGENENAVVYMQLKSRGVEGDELASELLDHFIAGAEAPRTTLTYLQWELCRNPRIQGRLRQELQTLSPSNSSHVKVPNLKKLDTLPLLDAVLTETLRLYTPTPGPQHRITPPEGANIERHFIPGGTKISASLGVLHQREKVFSEAGSWKPERWITDDGKKLEEMRRWFWAFSKGSRTCVGKDFTLIVMKLIIFTIYARYSTEIVEDEKMAPTDRFLVQPEGEKLVLMFSKAF
ncbi:cytochrome P450 [Massarina eburnea CBS 473.64]|uniref:Cytochrome P450 n=1 Tax=Massarina eburnea CBS 473.64 TaxID=1395130 RepID=A0A6A6RHK3_9PLEO|nr:cytochrome P450 [Massarina eburnea CBS 473.64]